MQPVKATVTRIVDGDTVVLHVRCRLAREDAAELSTPEAKIPVQSSQQGSTSGASTWWHNTAETRSDDG